MYTDHHTTTVLSPVDLEAEVRLRRLFPPTVEIAATTLNDKVGSSLVKQLHASEAAEVARAVPQRQHEFAAGRACARRALARFGLARVSVPRDPERFPLWPAGFVGSISHCRTLCVAVVAEDHQLAGLGVDVESAGPLSDDIRAVVCTPAEMTFARDVASPPGSDWAKVIFSAKESVYKCLYPSKRVPFDFQDVSLTIDPIRGAFRAHVVYQGWTVGPGRGVTGRFQCTDRHVVTSAFLD